jgi:hypothetical protein
MADGTQIYGLTTLDTSLTTSHVTSAGTIIIGSGVPFTQIYSAGAVNTTIAFASGSISFNNEVLSLVGSNLYFDNALMIFRNVYAGPYYGAFTTYADDGFRLALGSAAPDNESNRNLVIGDYAWMVNTNRDYDHNTLSPNPTLFIHSATDPDTRNKEFGSLAHNTSDFLVGTGTGNVVIMARSQSSNFASLASSSYALYIDEVTGQLKGTVRYSNGTTGLCTLCSITT